MNNQDIMIKNDLTAEQWKLYEFLKCQYKLNPNRWLEMEQDIYHSNELRENYPFIPHKTSFNNSQARRRLTNDLLALKESQRIQITILSNSKGIKIATEDEAHDELLKEKISILKSLKRVNFQLSKLEKDGQSRLVFNSEKPFIEAFLKDYDKGEEE